MAATARINFVRQQGFAEAEGPACGTQYAALMFQPRLTAILVAIGLVLQVGPLFLALSAILWWNVLLPELNPFDAFYNRFVARPKGLARLTPDACAGAETFRAGHGRHVHARYRPVPALGLAVVGADRRGSAGGGARGVGFREILSGLVHLSFVAGPGGVRQPHAPMGP